MKCFIVSLNRSEVVQPDGVANSNEPAGALLIIRFLKKVRGKINTGGIELPFALMKQQTVKCEPFYGNMSKKNNNKHWTYK